MLGLNFSKALTKAPNLRSFFLYSLFILNIILKYDKDKINSLYKFIALKTILDKQQLHLSILRLSHQLLENHLNLDEVVFIGLQPRGIKISDLLVENIRNLYPLQKVQYGLLDITFYRDDIRDELHVANKTEIPFSIEGKKVILIDDVLYTGRTIRAALDALQDFGRPQKIELCVLVDRRFNRELPIQPDYCGKSIDTLISQKVKVEWEREEVVLY
jgi:pyrimidine operon attenuation protein / uracil phosphoribosyltransferase